MFLLLFSAAKVGKKIEIDVSLLEKVVSNQEKMSGVPMDERKKGQQLMLAFILLYVRDLSPGRVTPCHLD